MRSPIYARLLRKLLKPGQWNLCTRTTRSLYCVLVGVNRNDHFLLRQVKGMSYREQFAASSWEIYHKISSSWNLKGNTVADRNAESSSSSIHSTRFSKRVILKHFFCWTWTVLWSRWTANWQGRSDKIFVPYCITQYTIPSLNHLICLSARRNRCQGKNKNQDDALSIAMFSIAVLVVLERVKNERTVQR